MPYILCIFLLMQTLCSQAQCKDIYGDKADCPGEQDSLVIYNNALKVIEFYSNNKSYQLINSVELSDNSQKLNVYEDLKQARRLFNIIRREVASFKDDKFSAGKPSIKYKDISYSQYYQEIDENRFYQRELENQIVNIEAPISMYDTRISPVLVNSYKCTDTSSVYLNDLVNIPIYVPVIVKPFALLTEPELVLRYKALHITPKVALKRTMEKRDSTNTFVARKIIDEVKMDTINKKDSVSIPIVREVVKKVTKDTIIHVNDMYVVKREGLPIYAFNGYGSGGVIGFMFGHKFKKLLPKQYGDYAVPLFARELLANDVELEKYLKLKFGAYYEGFY